AAWEPERRYLDIGLRLLPEGAFEERHDLAFALHVEATEAAYLGADFERAEALSNAAMEHASTLMERVLVLEKRMLFQTAGNRFHDTVRTGLYALELLGVHLPKQPSPEDFPAALSKSAAALAGRRIEDLERLPLMTDEGMLAVFRIVVHSLNAPALIT